MIKENYQDKIDILALATLNELDLKYLCKWIKDFELNHTLKQVIRQDTYRFKNYDLSIGATRLSGCT
jgi:hypothetical protein